MQRGGPDGFGAGVPGLVGEDCFWPRMDADKRGWICREVGFGRRASMKPAPAPHVAGQQSGSIMPSVTFSLSRTKSYDVAKRKGAPAEQEAEEGRKENESYFRRHKRQCQTNTSPGKPTVQTQYCIHESGQIGPNFADTPLNPESPCLWLLLPRVRTLQASRPPVPARLRARGSKAFRVRNVCSSLLLPRTYSDTGLSRRQSNADLSRQLLALFLAANRRGLICCDVC